jgi:hypothetical protein
MTFSNGFSFSNLSLEGVQAAAAAKLLPPGRYVAKVVNAEVADSKSGGKLLKFRVEDVKGRGILSGNLNLMVPGSEKATQIGLEQLKGLLVHGGHPDPDNIGMHGVQSIKGLTVGVVVGTEVYNGENRSRITGFCPPSEVVGYEDTDAAKSSGGLDDDIPFANPYRGKSSYVV